MIKNFLLKFKYAFGGIFYALRNDKSYRQQFYGVATLIVLFVIFFHPLDRTEVMFIALAYTLMLITELQNSAFEEALDRIHPEHHEDIGRSKDMAAGAVLTASFFLVFVMGTIVFF